MIFKSKLSKSVAVLIAVVISGPLLASGSFNPSSSGPGSAAFSRGKALASGRSGDTGCKQCHQFKRRDLNSLSRKISSLVTDCAVHKPCLSQKLDSTQLSDLDTYFGKRYRLKLTANEK